MARLEAAAYCPSSSRRKGPQNIFVYILLALFDFLFFTIFINPETIVSVKSLTSAKISLNEIQTWSSCDILHRPRWQSGHV